MAEVKLVISGDPAVLKRAVRESAVAMDELQRSGESLTASTAKSTAAAERYIEALKREAIALGANEEALRRYDMAQLGLSQKAQEQAQAIHRAIDAHKEAEKAADAHGASMERLGKHLGNMINIAATAAATLAGVVTGEIIKKTIEAEQSHLRLQATLTATGYAAGKTREQIEQLVAEMSKKTFFDDEKIREAATAMLRFKDVGGEAFDLALRLSADLAASMGTDLVSAARQVGSALQDPERGLRMLADAGRNLSSVQRGLIKDLIESGQHAKALQIMLDELNGTVGGTAEALNTGMKEATVGVDKAWDDLLKTLGKSDLIGGNVSRVFQATADALRDIDDLLARGLGDRLARLAGYGLHLTGGAMSLLGMRGGQVLQDQAAQLGGSTYGAKPAEARPLEAVIADQATAALGRMNQEAERASEQVFRDLNERLGETLRVATDLGKENERAAKSYERIQQAAQRFVTAMENEAATVGMSKAEKKLYEAAVVAATLRTDKEREALMARAKAAYAVLDADEKRIAQEKLALAANKDSDRAHREYNKGLDNQVTALERELAALVKSNEEYGLSRAAIEEATLAKLEHTLATLDTESATQKEIDTLQKRIDLQRQIVEQARKGDGMREQTKELKEQARLWDQVSTAAGDFFADLVMNGGRAFENLRDYVKQLMADMIALFAKRWILQLAAGATGNAALGVMAGQVGQGTVAGGLMDWVSGGSTAYSAYGALGGIGAGLFGSAAAYSTAVPGLSYGGTQAAMLAQQTGVFGAQGLQMTAAAGQGATGAGMSAMSIAGIVAIVVAAMVANDRFFGQGWRADDQDRIADMPGGPLTGDRILRGLGLNDRWASLLSGSSLHTRLWGHGPMRSDAYGVRGSFTGTGITGEAWQDWSRQGGTFRSDIRGTETAAMSPSQARFFDDLLRPVTAVIDRLGERFGVDPAAALRGYSRDFDVQLSNNGEPLTEEEARSLFGDLMAGVMQDQVGAILAAADQGALAEYVRQLEGSGEEITRGVQNVLNYLDALTQLDDMIAALEGGPIVALTQQLDAMRERVDKGFEALNAAVNEGDIERTVSAEQELLAAIVQRYETEIAMVRQLQAAIDNLQQEAYQFALNVAGRINAVGGSRDIGAIAMGRAGELRGTIGGDRNPGRQLGNLGQYVGAIDTWYNSRRSEIERDIQAQAAAAAAASAAQQAAQQAVYQARISALQTELELTQQWAGVLDRAGQMMDRMRLTGLNPLHALGRLDLAQGASEEAGAAYRSSAGGERAMAANRYLDALQRELELLPEALQRPSPEYQARYNAIIAQLAEVEGDARTGEERALELQEQLNRLQGEANAIAAATFDVNAAMNAAMEGLNEEALAYYTYAEEEGQRLYALQIQQHEEQLDAITGGMEVELFIAQLEKEQVARLTQIRDAIEALPERLRDLLAQNGSPGPGNGGDDDGASNGATTVVLKIDEKEIGRAVIPAIDARMNARATEYRQRLDVS